MQQHSLLATKLHIPPIRPELVARPRLIERLNAGLSEEGFARKLTLVSAPAGFGKTTLVSQWVRDCGRAVACAGPGAGCACYVYSLWSGAFRGSSSVHGCCFRLPLH